MSLLRTFIAIEIPPEIHEGIERSTAALRGALPNSLVRWVPGKNIHLTLKFLGGISPKNLDVLSDLLDLEASRHPAFELTFGGLGIFPNPRRPRIIWVGIQAPPELADLHHSIEAASVKLGYPAEKRPFSPHLTIGRVKGRLDQTGLQKIRDTIQSTRVGELGSASVTAVHIFKSDLKPTGAIYTRLHAASLKKKLSKR